jgi:DNA-binding transcriptional ArsR family regulator
MDAMTDPEDAQSPDEVELVNADLLLGTTGSGPFLVDANKIATGRTCIIGSSGSGKSYAVGVVCEELCKNGVPFALLDTEGEYSGLKGGYELIRVGEDEDPDIQWAGLDLEDLAMQAPEIAPLILDLSEADEPKAKVGLFLSSLYREISRRRTPYLVIVEEADRFVPQSGERLPIFGELSRRGRKRGLGLMICTQRPSLVDKNVLSQCGNQLIGKLVIRNDLQSVSQFFPGNSLPKQLTSMVPGEFYALGGLSPEPVRLKIRERETRHGGSTPALARRVLRPYRNARVSALTGSPPQSPAAAPMFPPKTQACGLLGFAPTILADDVPLWVKREKRYVLFGREEVVTSVQLVYRELADLAVRLRTGRLRKRFETKYVTVDGQTGRFAHLDGGISFREGVNRFLGLNSQQVELLWVLRGDRELSAVELAAKTGVSSGVIRNQLRVLEGKRLVRVSEVGRAKVYKRLVDPPNPEWRTMPLKLDGLDVHTAKVMGTALKEDDVREVVRALWGESELESSTPFLYPFYRVELAMKKRQRLTWIDGRTGKNVDI